MRPVRFPLGIRLLIVSVLCLVFLLCRPTAARSTLYVHSTPLSFTWTPSTGSVAHYNVYVSVNGGLFNLFAEVSTNTCRVDAQDGRRYVIQVDAEDAQGNRSSMSDRSEEVVVFLGGSASDTDGDGMPNTWEVSEGLNPYDPADAGLDRDGDGLSNRDEYLHGTLCSNPDTDRDGVSDGTEVRNGQNPLNAADNAPTANAGPDQVVDPTVVTLDGTRSSDPNRDPLSFSWTQTSGTTVKLSNAAVSKPTFLVNKRGDYRFRLVVSDGKVESAPDEVTVTARNVKPTANAGQDQVVDAGTRVTLDGSASQDPNEDALTYSWSQKGGTPVILQDARTRTASFVPWLSGVYLFELVACDDQLCSDPDGVQVVVNGQNRVPSADAGRDQVVQVQNLVVLDGSGSTDPDGDPLGFSWSQAEGPKSVVLQAATEVRASFRPDQVGVYRFELVVDDGTDASPPDSVTVTVEGENRRPVAVADAVDRAEVGDWVALDGSASYDPDGDLLNFQWRQTAGAQAALVNATGSAAGFFAVTAGNLEFELVVNDGELASAPARVVVVVTDENEAPVADVGEDLYGLPGDEVCLDGSGSFDPDPRDVITYSWSQTKGTRVTLSGAQTARPCFTAANLGEYVFGLTVSDGKVQSTQDKVTVRIKETSGGSVPDDPPGDVSMSSSSGGCTVVRTHACGSECGPEALSFIAILFLPALFWASCQKRRIAGKRSL